MTYIMRVDELKKRLETKDDLVIVDVRFQLNDPEAGRKMYVKDHLPGAVYLDLNHDLASKPEKHGGNHPLPNVSDLATKLGNIGIDQDTVVVIYDQENDMFAARLWFLLYYMGHEKAYILEGGYKRWVEMGNQVTDIIPVSVKKTFRPQIQENLTVQMEEVREKMKSKSAILIDSRSKERYLGLEEPLYRKAGHIPGAIHYFWKDVFTKDGKWKEANDLEKHFASLPKDEEIIVSCGSGISACPNFLALKRAGYENIKLYPGSFSDWISYEENKIEVGEE